MAQKCLSVLWTIFFGLKLCIKNDPSPISQAQFTKLIYIFRSFFSHRRGYGYGKKQPYTYGGWKLEIWAPQIPSRFRMLRIVQSRVWPIIPTVPERIGYPTRWSRWRRIQACGPCSPYISGYRVFRAQFWIFIVFDRYHSTDIYRYLFLQIFMNFIDLFANIFKNVK